MKKITTGIFAAIALLTMSFTVAEQAGVFKADANLAVECRTEVSIPNPPLPQVNLVRSVNNCNGLEAYEGQIATPQGGGTVSSPDQNCGGTEKFCCASMDITTGEILKIHCEPQPE